MISIALASYNGEKYIRQQIDSILAQTIQKFELVVCDDCSTDSTLTILQEYEKNDSRIHVYENEQNLGFKKNFEKAVSLCSGEYIAFCDQDDIWLPEHLQFLLENIEGFSLSCGNNEYIRPDGSSMNTTGDRECRFTYTTGNFLYMLLLRGNKFQGASMMMLTDFAKRNLPIPPSVKYHDIWFACCACMEHGLNYKNDVITKYRIHGNNVTSPTRKGFLRILFKQFFKDGVKTESFGLCRELEKRYGNSNEDFKAIQETLNHIENKALTFSDIKFLWKHYYDIGGKKTHLDFIPSLFVWNSWKK